MKEETCCDNFIHTITFTDYYRPPSPLPCSACKIGGIWKSCA
jgi:hypothetical protein